MEILGTFRWSDADAGGRPLRGVACDREGSVYVVLGSQLMLVCKGGLAEESKVDDSTTPEMWTPLLQVGDGTNDDVVYAVNFTTAGQVLMSTKSNGLELFSCVDPATAVRQAHLPDFRGPVSLSHPSSSAIGVDLSADKPYGQFTAFDVGKDTLDHKAVDLWGDMGSWLSTLEARGDTVSLRRCWYGAGQQMLYFVDDKSDTTPEDGVRSLHLRGHIMHTYMSVPLERGIPFRVEVPHMASGGELLVLSPAGVTFESGVPLVSFPADSGKATTLFTATDMDGKWKERMGYALAYPAVGEGDTITNTLRVLKAVHT